MKTRQRVRVHLGTSEVLARVSVLNTQQTIEPGSRGHAQFRLEAPVAAAYGDRFIIRSYSPQRTIAGGLVLDPLAHRHKRSDIENINSTLGALAASLDGRGNLAETFVQMSGERGLTIEDLRSRTGLRGEVINDLVDRAAADAKVVNADGILIDARVFERLQNAALKAVEKHHALDKLSRGLPKEVLREQVFKRAEPEVFRAVTASLERAGKIRVEQDVIKLASHETRLSPAEQEVRDRLKSIYKKAGLEAPKLDDALMQATSGGAIGQTAARKIFQLLVNGAELVAVTNEYYFSAESLELLKISLREFVRSSGDPTIDVPKFKEIAGVSRKYAIPLLEFLDRTHVTRRFGDKRQIL